MFATVRPYTHIRRTTHLHGCLGAGETRALVSAEDQAETAFHAVAIPSGGPCRSSGEVSSRSWGGQLQKWGGRWFGTFPVRPC